MNKILYTNSVARKHKHSLYKLMRYNTPFVANAEKEICRKMLGAKNYNPPQNRASFMREELMKAESDSDYSLAKTIRISPHLRHGDYDLHPLLFSGIHTAMSIFRCFNDLKGKNVLEIGANWGPYMHLLRHRYGANTFGVDISETAVAYAKRGGLNFICGDASKMDFFQNNSFDIVVSHNFLDYAYMVLFHDNDATPFIEKIFAEVHRVLKPGGYFFSQEELVETQSPVFDLFSKCSSLEIPNCSQPVIILQK